MLYYCYPLPDIVKLLQVCVMIEFNVDVLAPCDDHAAGWRSLWDQYCDGAIDPAVSDETWRRLLEAIASTLTSYAVWPDVQGDLYAVPAIESAWRPVYLRHSLLLASLGAGEISLDDFRETIREDREVFQIRQLSPDMNYARYLARLRDRGGVVETGVRSAAELEKANLLAKEVIREVMPEEFAAA